MKGKRTRNIFDPKSKEPYKLSRSKLENFLRCQLCFYLDRRLGVDQPPGFPFTLNVAVDHLLKKEFDIHRVAKTAHPLMEKYGIDAVPFEHPDMEKWRDNFTGVQCHHKPSNFIFTGAVDDIWINSKNELHVVDYKATSKDGDVGIDAEWQGGYKRQMEIYQWLLRQNGFKVSNAGYFVYVNGRKDLEAFDGKLEFYVDIIQYSGSDKWVEQALIDARECLENNTPPSVSENCDYCNYRETANAALKPV